MDDFFNDPMRNLFEPIKSVTEVNRLLAEAYDYGKPYTEAKRTEMLRQAGYLAKKIGMATPAYQRASVYRKQACLPVTNRASSEPPTPQAQSPWDVIQQVGNNLHDLGIGGLTGFSEGYLLTQMYVITNISDSTLKLQGGHWTSNLTDGYNRIKEMGEERIQSQQYYYMGKTAGSTASIGLGIHQTVLGAYTGASLISGGITIGAGGSIGSFGLATVPAIAVSVPAVVGGVASVGVAAMGGTSVYFSIGQFRDNLEKAIEESKKASSEGTGKSVDDILGGAKETTNGAGVARNFEKTGGFNQTLDDFNNLKPTNVKDIQTQYGPGKVGTLPDGGTVVARPGSNTGGPTLEIKISNSKVYKIRYGD